MPWNRDSDGRLHGRAGASVVIPPNMSPAPNLDAVFHPRDPWLRHDPPVSGDVHGFSTLDPLDLEEVAADAFRHTRVRMDRLDVHAKLQAQASGRLFVSAADRSVVQRPPPRPTVPHGGTRAMAGGIPRTRRALGRTFRHR